MRCSGPRIFRSSSPARRAHPLGDSGKWLEVLGCGVVHPNVFKPSAGSGEVQRLRLRHGRRAHGDAALRA